MSLKHIIKYKQNIPSLSPMDTVMDAIDQMRETGSGVVLIADDQNHLVGLFAERDAMFKIAASDLDPRKTLLGDAMVTDIIKIEDTISPTQALQTMVEGRIRHLPVVTKDNEIVGILSLRYLLHDRINELRDELQRLESYFNDAQGG